MHMPALGGRRKALPQSKNTAWKNDAFRGYADYMETDEFKEGIEELEKIAITYEQLLCVRKLYGGDAIVQ